MVTETGVTGERNRNRDTLVFMGCESLNLNIFRNYRR
jgi:hypothetical protein